MTQPGGFPYKLGRLPARADRRTLSLARYLRALPPPPDAYDGSQGLADWGMLGNDTTGDCAIAAALHMEMAWSTLSIGTAQAFTDQQAEADYFRLTGGPDTGLVELDVLKDWRTHGLAGDKIHAFAQVAVADATLMRQACALFTGVYVGLALPLTAQDQEVWDDTGATTPDAQPWSWGGHAVPILTYDWPGKRIGFPTWGVMKTMTPAFWARYGEECWAVLPEDFAGGHVDFRLLDADLAEVGGAPPAPPPGKGCNPFGRGR